MRRKYEPTDLRLAIRIYYERLSLSNSDIKSLFGITSDATVVRYKREVVEYFAKDGISPYHINHRLDTYRAYEAWGLDIADLEKRLAKLKKLEFIQ